jgi:hypothetical protein
MIVAYKRWPQVKEEIMLSLSSKKAAGFAIA